MNAETILRGLVDEKPSAKKALAKLADGNEASRVHALAKLAAKTKAFAPAHREVALACIPSLALWVPWGELMQLEPLVDAYGFDDALLAALSSNIEAIRNEADAVFMRDASVARAKAMLAKVETAPRLVRQRGVPLVFLSVLAEHGVAIPAKWDASIIVSYDEYVAHEDARLRQVLAALPMKRRLALLATEARKASGAKRRIYRKLMDLAPGLPAILLAESKDLRAALSERELTQWKKKLPEVARTLKTFEAKLAKIPQPPKPPKPAPGPFTFDRRTVVKLGDYGKLDALGKAQWRLAAEGYIGGGRVSGPRQFVARLKREELDEGDAEMRTWRVLRDGAHVYDAWIVWVDNASFFVAGTPKRAPFYMVQDSVLPTDKKPASAELAKLIAASVPKRGLW